MNEIKKWRENLFVSCDHQKHVIFFCYFWKSVAGISDCHSQGKLSMANIQNNTCSLNFCQWCLPETLVFLTPRANTHMLRWNLRLNSMMSAENKRGWTCEFTVLLIYQLIAHSSQEIFENEVFNGSWGRTNRQVKIIQWKVMNLTIEK